LTIDTVGEKWFYRGVTSSRVKTIKIEKPVAVYGGMNSVQGVKNVTPKISLEEPVVNNSWKGLLGMFRDFVAVGGDFV